jgi:hypothetical protein
MNATAWWALVTSLPLAVGCGKSEAAARAVNPTAPPASSPLPSRSPMSHADCAHAICADNFFVDVVAPNDCVAGAVCRLTLKLAATGDFHINDEYPYRFRADDTREVTFAGTDGSGKNVFSKAAGDWTKSDAKTGSMAVSFLLSEKGSKTISGAFKLSVCSTENCLLEQPQVKATVLAR